MISETMQEAINDQINREIHSARWMRAQYEEELGHGLKLLDFVVDCGGKVELKVVKAPPSDFGSPLGCFEAALEHERSITGDLAKIYDQSMREKDHAAHALMEWFMTEQVEEEKVAEEIVDKLKLAGDNGAAVLMMEIELGKRLAAAPSPAGSS